MITSLSIENFALIEKMAIQFPDGFSTITGETGAGKSILLGALALVLGKRADLSSLKNQNEKCVIEAIFSIKNYQLQEFFQSNDLDYEDETIIRREILPSGKSRAFINDTPVNLQILIDLSASLIDVHSQNQTLELHQDEYQFQIIDAVAQNFELVNQYQSILKEYKKAKSQLSTKQNELASSTKEQDYNLFLLTELNDAKLDNIDFLEIESEFDKLNNVEFIKEQLVNALSILSNEELGTIEHLKGVKSNIQKIANFSSEFESIFERISSVLIELADIDNELKIQAESLVSNPEQLELLNQKIQLINSLQKKHFVNSIEELIEIKNNLSNKFISVSELEIEIKEIEAELLKLITQLDNLSLQIHENRSKAVPKLIENLKSILHLLGMPNANFQIQITQTNTYFQNGKDQIELLFAANKGSNFGLLKKVASGGEMSRIMFAVKSILAAPAKNNIQLPTIIFDEIDTGVSGEIAHKMAEIMHKMGEFMQVLSITHLPQIASKGKHHFKVFKQDVGNKTITNITKLNDEERVVEIAQMLSGSQITESALNNAKELLN
jgi:DNA repair protein RecN (Recombination protein N)